MKLRYTLIAIIAIFSCTIAQAQIKKGTSLVGGTLAFASNKTEFPQSTGSPDGKTKQIIINPSYGYAIKDNLVLGVDLSFGQLTIENTVKSTTWSKGGSIFLRRYWEILRNFYVYGQANAGVEWYKTEYSNTGNLQLKNFNITGSIKPGIAYSVSKRIQLESSFISLLNISYKQTTFYNSNTKAAKMNTFDANSSLNNASNFSVGVRVMLGS